MLDTERQYFKDNQAQWQIDHPGKFMLVKGELLIGAFDTMGAALSEGARRFGMGNYLVRHVAQVEQEVSIPALTLGILRADSSSSILG